MTTQGEREALVKRLRDTFEQMRAKYINCCEYDYGVLNAVTGVEQQLNAALTAQQSAAEPVALVCHIDGSKCGVGGYCDDCPHPAVNPISMTTNQPEVTLEEQISYIHGRIKADEENFDLVLQPILASLLRLQRIEAGLRKKWTDIDDVIKEYEKDPEKLAALNRARDRLAEILLRGKP